ncbi:MAG TPA: hypothetical protein PK286_07090 [Devosia sp.]|nr:hypothetical protein [Devosia sp.]
MRFPKIISIALLALSTMILPVQAQNDNSRVMVPDGPSGGAVVAGCFRADRLLFGYRFTMCLRTRGTYIVSGNGMNCEGRLTWRTSGRNIAINIHRQSCGRGRAWEAATIDCRASGLIHNILESIFGRGSANPFVMVPDTPAIRTLTCTYNPTVRGVARKNFTARRQ